MTTHATTDVLLECLDTEGIPYVLVSHQHTESALGEADALGVDPDSVAKTIVLSTADGFVRAVIPGSCRLDMHKVREYTGAHTELATEEELAGAYPEFELGAVPPVADAHGDRILIDVALSELPWVYIEAGTHEQSCRVRPRDLIAQDDASVAAICAD